MIPCFAPLDYSPDEGPGFRKFESSLGSKNNYI